MLAIGMVFKKIQFEKLNYKDLDRFGAHDQKRDELQAFYQTFDFLDLIMKWPEIVGEKLAHVTSPLSIKRGSLIIVTRHPSYSQHLFDMSEIFKKKIFETFPQLRSSISKLNFISQESFFKAQDEKQETLKRKVEQSTLHPQSPEYKRKMLEAQRLFADIEDEEHRRIMISLYLQH